MKVGKNSRGRRGNLIFSAIAEIHKSSSVCLGGGGGGGIDVDIYMYNVAMVKNNQPVL